jgi:hypothetical protein
MRCRRCGAWAEDPDPASGRVPDGKGGYTDVDDLVLCMDCDELRYVNVRAFWEEGWQQPAN